MRRPSCKIQVGNYAFDYVTELELVSAWKNVTDTGFIRLPQRVTLRNETIVAGDGNLFKRGDSVTISVGYFPESTLVFMGYVSDIIPGSPFELRIEDSAYLFKQTSITKSYRSVTLEELLTDLSPIPFEAIDVTLGAFRISRANFAQVIAELKKSYGLNCWVREGVLYAGLAYQPGLQKTHSVRMQEDVYSEDLVYQRSDDIRIKVKAISILPDNTRLEVSVGDSDGEERTLNFYNLDLKTLEETAERELPKLKYTGYKGSITISGKPLVNHGDVVEITDIKTPERDGSYFVDEVVLSQGAGGFRQSVKLGAKASI